MHTKSSNLKFTPNDRCAAARVLPWGLSEVDKKLKLEALCTWIAQATYVSPSRGDSYVIVPCKATNYLFYIIRFDNEAVHTMFVPAVGVSLPRLASGSKMT